MKLAGRVVLSDISLSLSPGHLVALVGPNGAGKTTLLRALAGLVPSDGAIHVGGDALASLSLRERARRFAYLPQGHIVHWPLPARDIVALGRYPHGATDPARLTPKDIEAVLRAMQAADVIAFSERRVTELSGGERSRVALARVFAVEAPVILADEPTSSLDPRHQIDVMKTLRAAADKGTLVIVVTHDLGLAARFADLVWCFRMAGWYRRAPRRGAVGKGDGRRVPDQRLSRRISARGRDRAMGGNLAGRLNQSQPVCTGPPAFFQASMPPVICAVLVRPLFLAAVTAIAEHSPKAQKNTMRRPLAAATSRNIRRVAGFRRSTGRGRAAHPAAYVLGAFAVFT